MIMAEAPGEQAPNHKPISIKLLITLFGDMQWAKIGQVAEFSVCVRGGFRVMWQRLENLGHFYNLSQPEIPAFQILD